MGKVYFGALICALFCGWLVAGCRQLPRQGALEAPLASTVFSTELPSTVTAQSPMAQASTNRSATAQSPTLQPTAPTATPTTATAVIRTPDAASAVPARVDTVVVYEEQITLPTYPFARYQIDAVDPTYNWPYKRFDVERFRAEAPAPALQAYRLVVLENAYLKLLILPELGGRLWQVIHKPSGAPIFYQNTVVKPTHWGIADQLGWLALGGLEWGLPVIEHGYDWGTPWEYRVAQQRADLATVTLFTPEDGRLLSASITIGLRAGAASFTIEPTLRNLADNELAFSFWHDAMLAPGSGKQPSAQLHFVLPSNTMTLHSTGDSTMPPPAGRFSWPLYQGRDLSRLGNFTQYLGFFEAPSAHGPFVGVYDPLYDAGVVRTFPPEIMRGSKVFALGWQDALTSDNYTDDQSVYIELHGGLAPTFDDRYRLPAQQSITWQEAWYPVQGIGDLTYANAAAALSIKASGDTVAVNLYTPQPVDGTLTLVIDGKAEAQVAVHVRPDLPFLGSLPFASKGAYTVELRDSAGSVLLTYAAQSE